MNDKLKFILTTTLNATFLLTLATGISYMLGYLYWEGFYAHFGISIRMIETSKEQFLLYGSSLLLPLFLFVGILFLLSYWPVTLAFDNSKSQQNKFFQWLEKQLHNFLKFHWIFLLPVVLIIIALFFIRPIQVSHDFGKEVGSKYALCSAPLAEVVYKDETSKVKKRELGLLTISKGAYFFFEPNSTIDKTLCEQNKILNASTNTKSNKKPPVIILQKESLISVTITKTVKDYK